MKIELPALLDARMQILTMRSSPLRRYCSTTNTPQNVFCAATSKSGIMRVCQILPAGRSCSLPSQWPRPADAVRLPKKIRVGIIGFEGHTAEITGPLDRLPDVEIVAYWDSGGKKQSKLGSAKPVFRLAGVVGPRKTGRRRSNQQQRGTRGRHRRSGKAQDQRRRGKTARDRSRAALARSARPSSATGSRSGCCSDALRAPIPGPEKDRQRRDKSARFCRSPGRNPTNWAAARRGSIKRLPTAGASLGSASTCWI